MALTNHVLLVSGDAQAGALMRNAFDGLSLSLEHAGSAEQALPLLADAKPVDALFGDMDAPAAQCEEIARVARGRTPRPVLIALTSDLRYVRGRDWTELGFRHCFGKPFASIEGVVSALRTELAHRAGRSSVLVGDDDPAVRAMLRCILESDGYEVLEAGDAQSVFAQISYARPDVLFLDNLQVSRDGDSCLAALRASPTGRHLQIVLCTGCTDRVYLERGRQLGVTGILTKPFTAQQASAMVRKAVDQA